MQYIVYNISKPICKIYIYIKIIGFQKFLLNHAINKDALLHNSFKQGNT